MKECGHLQLWVPVSLIYDSIMSNEISTEKGKEGGGILDGTYIVGRSQVSIKYRFLHVLFPGYPFMCETSLVEQS